MTKLMFEGLPRVGKNKTLKINRKTLIGFLALLLLLGGISYRALVVSRDTISGEYFLSGKDGSGRPILFGNLSLSVDSRTTVKGHCVLVRTDEPYNGGFIKNGPCVGSVTENTIDLPSTLDDGGIDLIGEYRDGKIIGRWMNKSIVGSVPQGEFEASKTNGG